MIYIPHDEYMRNLEQSFNVKYQKVIDKAYIRETYGSVYWYAKKYMYVEVYQQTSDRTSHKRTYWKIRKMIQNIGVWKTLGAL